MDLKHFIGSRIRAARRRQKLTQQQLAERIGKAVETISNIERGHSWPSLETLEQVGVALDLPLAACFDGYRGQSVSPKRAKLESELKLALDELGEREALIALHLVRALATVRRSSPSRS